MTVFAVCTVSFLSRWGRPDFSPQSPSERTDWQTHNAVLSLGCKKRSVKAGRCGERASSRERERWTTSLPEPRLSLPLARSLASTSCGCCFPPRDRLVSQFDLFQERKHRNLIQFTRWEQWELLADQHTKRYLDSRFVFSWLCPSDLGMWLWWIALLAHHLLLTINDVSSSGKRSHLIKKQHHCKTLMSTVPVATSLCGSDQMHCVEVVTTAA